MGWVGQNVPMGFRLAAIPHRIILFRNLAETDEKLQCFWSENRGIIFFFNFFITKVSYFVSNLNKDFPEASFEVYYVSVSQKLAILGFSPQIFFILTSVTSETS